MLRRTLWLTLSLLALTPAVPGVAATPNDYADPATWLCRPGRLDSCAVDQTTSVVAADGSVSLEFADYVGADAPIDCFYVYPTVSRDETANSDMVPGPGEIGVVRSQLARFASQCRVYAPLYRQFTLTALRRMMAGDGGGLGAVDRNLGYNDVLDAWNHYLAHDNDGRGVVLIGHSQGSGVLTRLIAAEIDGKPVQERVVSALLLGTNVAVPPGQDVGGSFQHMPLCREADQTGCIVTYVTFRSTIPPPATSLFGRVRGGGGVAACTNPAALGGGPATLHAYLDTAGREWIEGGEVATSFVSVPGLLTGECVEKHGASYLEVTVNADSADPRADDIAGDVVTGGEVNPTWGLHLIDVGVAMGDLVDLVGRQAAAYRSR